MGVLKVKDGSGNWVPVGVGFGPANFGQWTAYTPQVIAATTNPNLGSAAAIAGAYCQIGRLVNWWAVLTANGTGISPGNGQYGITLPPVTPRSLAFVIVGQGWIYGTAGFQALTLDGVPNPRMMRAMNGSFLDHTSGFSSGGNVLTLAGFYESAA